MEVEDYFKFMVDQKASDLFLKTGSRPSVRVDGRIRFISGDESDEGFCHKVFRAIAGGEIGDLMKGKEMDLACEMDDVGRFRVNVFHHRGELGFVFRHIQSRIPTFEELNLPVRQHQHLAGLRRGLVLITGVAGSGKSTTIASMLEYINQTRHGHIVTIEDPIEFVFENKQCLVNQREVGIDTDDFMDALRMVVRQAPDVIMIGEMRDLETMEAAISAAETGHLVFSTLHTVNAIQTVERIITFFPPHQHDLIRLQLSMVLQGVISQRLLPKKEGRGRVPALEIMISTPTIKEILAEGRTDELYGALQEGEFYGNMTFNQSLKLLYEKGLISLEEAMAAADNPDELKLEIRGVQKRAATN
ncbi:MAG: type IV pilus twitching motility protein PilT [Planctomycetota bacterium]|jgi:twitching motility protein PilT